MRNALLSAQRARSETEGLDMAIHGEAAYLEDI